MENDCCKKYFLTFATETKLVYKDMWIFLCCYEEHSGLRDE